MYFWLLCTDEGSDLIEMKIFSRNPLWPHLSEFWILFDLILIWEFLPFEETWCCFPMKWNLLLKLNFCWGFSRFLSRISAKVGNFWKQPFALTPKDANLSKYICSFICNFVVLTFGEYLTFKWILGIHNLYNLNRKLNI